MEVRWLEAFVAVAEEQHFGRAAARLHMAQSPLSQLVRKLEAELGVPVFERSTRHVRITPAGEALLPSAYRILNDLRTATESARSASGEVRGTVRLGFSGAHNHHTLPPLARAIRRAHPEIELKLVGGVRTKDGLDLLRRGSLDLSFIGIVTDPEPPLASRTISHKEVGLVVSVDHPLAGRRAVAPRELAGEPFVLSPLDGQSSLIEVIVSICHGAGFQPRIVQESSDPFIILTLVAADVGITLTGSELRDVLPSGTVWVPLEGEPVTFDHGLAWSTENLSPALEAVLRVSEQTLPSPAA